MKNKTGKANESKNFKRNRGGGLGEGSLSKVLHKHTTLFLSHHPQEKSGGQQESSQHWGGGDMDALGF